MPRYSIWFLDESQITLSNGTVLDGITQGDGSHLVGETLTLNSGGAQEILIRDRGRGDTNFADNDGDQRLDGTQTIAGTSYASGTIIEAEYQFTVTDGTNTYTVIGVNVNNSSPAYGTVEGLAFLGDRPPIGVPLTITSASEGPGATSTPASTYWTPPCFTPGTAIRTPTGDVPIESLRPGDRISTVDHGPQALIWIGRVHLDAARLRSNPEARPIRIRAGALGRNRPRRTTHVSPQHRVLLRDTRAELLFGMKEAFVAARHLCNAPAIHPVEDARQVTYIHLLLPQHAVIWANGLETESLQPGAATLPAFTSAAREALRPITGNRPYPAARPTLKAWEAAMLIDYSARERKTRGSSSGKSSAISPGPKRRAHSV